MTTAETTVGRIVDEWADRLARGEPLVADHALAQYPELASQLRLMLSALGAVSAVRADSTLPALAGFRMTREIGRGGMGVVYEAEDETLGRRVAVKVLPPHLLGRPEYVARFKQEARAAAGLHHTHIVPVFGVGESDGSHYIVMQFIPGRPPVSGQALPATAVAEMGAKLADALAFAHAHGVLHRDVKPGNVLVDAAGEPWLADFGLARVESADTLTDPDGFVGTLRYAAPERFAGVSDARSDVYALGLTLYELAAGKPAFDAPDRAELMRLVMDATPPRPRTVNPSIPRDLETVILKATARDPAHRYPSAAALADDLRRVLDGRPILAKRIGPVGRLWRWAKRHPVIAGLTAAVFVSLSLGLGGVYWQWRQSEQNYRQSEANATAAEQATGRERQSRDLAESHFYSLAIWRADARFADGENTLLRRLLDDLKPGEDRADRRGWEWYWLDATLTRRKEFSLPTGGKGSAMAVAPDGRIAVAVSGSIRVYDPTGKEMGRFKATAKPMSAMAWRPDGRALASADSTGLLVLWDVETGTELFTWQGIGKSTPAHLAWHPDGKQLAFGQATRADVLDAETGNVVASLPHKKGDNAPTVGWRPDGNTFTTTSYQRVRHWDAKTWQEREQVGWECGECLGTMDAAWSPCGQYFAVCGLGTVVKVFDANGKVVGVFRGHSAPLYSLAWAPGTAASPDPRLATGDHSGAIRVIDVSDGSVKWAARPRAKLIIQDLAWLGRERLVSNAFGNEPTVWNLDAESTVVTRHTSSVVALAWGDDNQVLSHDFSRNLRCANLTNPNANWSADRGFGLGTSAWAHNTLLWQPAAHRILTADTSGTVRVHDDRTGKVASTPLRLGDKTSAVAFDPGGERAVVTHFTPTQAYLWTVATGQKQPLAVEQKSLSEVAWSADGKRFAISGSAVQIFEADGTPLTRVATAAHPLAFDPSGTRLAVGGTNGTVELRAVSDGGLLHTLDAHSTRVNALTWSPDGRRLATSGGNGDVKLWDAHRGEALLTLRNGTATVNALSWSPLGRYLAAGTNDGLVRVWDSGHSFANADSDR